MVRKITKATVKGILQGAIVANLLVLTPNMEDKREVLRYLSRDPLAKLKSWPTRPTNKEDHLARVTDPIDVAMVYRPSRLRCPN